MATAQVHVHDGFCRLPSLESLQCGELSATSVLSNNSCRRLGEPTSRPDIDLNPDDPSHEGTCPGTRMDDSGPVVDGAGPTEKYR